MNETSRLSSSPPPPPPPARPCPPAARPRDASRPRSGEDEGGQADAALVAALAPPPLLGAWQAALQARETAPVPGAAGVLDSLSATQQAIASSASADRGQAQPTLIAEAGAAATPWRIEAEIRTGVGPAWQLALQRGPGAAGWSLDLATPAVPAIWAATQLPRLERRLRSQGHDVEQLGWRPLPEHDEQEGPR